VRPLNFASQPSRNETLPAVLFGAASVLLVAVTAYHAIVVRSLLPERTSKLHKEVAALEAEIERLQTEVRGMKAPTPDKGLLAEWGALKELVDRRTFSWTGLFARLEQVLPREVRLVSIAPDVKGGQVVLAITAVARPPQAGLGLVGALEGRGEFEDVYPVSVYEKEGGTAEFSYTMRYLPGVASEPVAAPAAASDEEAAIEEEEPAEDPEAGPAAAPAAGPSPSAAAPSVPPRGQRPPPGRRQPSPAGDTEPSPDAEESLN
jgi:hypothetical protein